MGVKLCVQSACTVWFCMTGTFILSRYCSYNAAGSVSLISLFC